ncbi:MAG: glycosyltransferase [Synechococcaceae cyanobacterium]|nr:glycosyltransferase [Synechococcaceae cyanobacterium]
MASRTRPAERPAAMRILSLSNCPLDVSQGSGYIVLRYSEGLRQCGHRVTLLGPESFDPWPQLGGKMRSWRLALGLALCALRHWRRPERGRGDIQGQLPGRSQGELHAGSQGETRRDGRSTGPSEGSRHDASNDPCGGPGGDRATGADGPADLIEFYGGEAWLALALLRLLPGRPALVIHANGLESHFFGTLISASRLGLVPHPYASWHQPNPIRLFDWAFRHADALVTVSDAEARYARRRRYQPPGRLLALANPLDPLWLDQPCLPSHERLIGYCGSWIPSKGTTLLARALAAVLPRHPDWSVLLIGVGSDFDPAAWFPAPLLPRIAVVPLERDKARLQQLYRRLAIACFPSLFESFGLALAEAMSCGVACLSTSTGYAADLEHGRQAWLLPSPPSAAALEDGLERLIADAPLRQRLASGGHQAVQRLRWPAAIHSLDGFYRELVAERRRPAGGRWWGGLAGLLAGLLLGVPLGLLLAWQLAPRPRWLAGQVQALHHQLPLRPVPCPRDAAVLVVLGQSHAANWIEPRYSGAIPANLLQYDWKRDLCLPYREPLLGSDHNGGALLTPALVALARRQPRPLLVAPLARGGSSVLEWAYGDLSHQNALVLRQLQARSLTPTLFLWHQGEKDAARPGLRPEDLRRVPALMLSDPDDFPFGLRQADAAAALQRVVERNLAAAPRARFGIALASACGLQPPDPRLRAAQRQVIASDPRLFLLVDSDRLIGRRWRYDHCHLSQEAVQVLTPSLVATLSRQLGPSASRQP